MREFELLTIDAIHQNLAPLVDALLQPAGFRTQKPLRWLRSDDAPIRQVFEYRQLKGGVLAPAWGFSLDFVPHLSARKLKWHRTEKSALLDAWIDGQIHRELDLTYMYGVSALLENLQPKVSRAVQKATEFWNRGRSLQQVCTLVEELKSDRWNITHSQLPMAYCFCLARSGRESDGRRELASLIASEALYPTTRPSEKTIADLWRAFEEALSEMGGDMPR
jgi:hypothetical protein